jgi:glycosyltransferase involved in cell wall biosynthesis
MNKTPDQPLLLLLDLSGNEQSAYEWASRLFLHQQIQPLKKAELKWSSKREALTNVRALKPATFAIFTNDLNLQSARCSMILFGALAGARRIVFGDDKARLIRRTKLTAFLFDAPRLALEFLFAYALIIPLSWLLTLLLGAALRFRDTARRINKEETSSNNVNEASSNNVNEASSNNVNEASSISKPEIGGDNEAQTTPSSFHPFIPSSLHPFIPSSLPSVSASQTALYIRATLTSATEGGLVTHVSGFANGAQSLGHRLQFLVSGESAKNEANRAAQVANSQHAIRPSASISATRAVFELWNNLLFTIKSINWLREDANENFGFIYQRYSRFNWTGVALSVLTGLPFALEFNGSEVWVSQSWDPVGQLRLLKRFERLNQRAADFIFTVSEVERRNVIGAGVDASKVFANPNGVDTNKFRPACGGQQIRQQLGIEDKIVVGFLGTFGPWHGAPVLAEAATKVQTPCHFLFIGDGDERAVSEAKLAKAKAPATFIGRVPHEKVAAYLDACDILVSPHVPATDGSDFFGSPTKLFEYLAMARPVIASRLGQIADVINDDENGLLVEPNDVENLVRAIERLASDAALRNRLGEAARKTVMENFTWQHNAASVFDTVRKKTSA